MFGDIGSVSLSRMYHTGTTVDEWLATCRTDPTYKKYVRKHERHIRRMSRKRSRPSWLQAILLRVLLTTLYATGQKQVSTVNCV